LRTLCALVVGSLALLLPSGAAGAVDPGIHFDPGSPSGKEYSIPLAQSRAEGAGTTNQHGAGNTLFGVGIRPPGGGGSGTGGGGASGTGGGGGSATGGGGGSAKSGGGGSGGASGLIGGGASSKAAGGSGATGPGHSVGHGKGGSSSGAAGTADLRGRIADAEHTGGTGIWNLGIVLAVLLPAVLLALLLRRRPRHRPV
jgi:hypothetical protein